MKRLAEVRAAITVTSEFQLLFLRQLCRAILWATCCALTLILVAGSLLVRTNHTLYLISQPFLVLAGLISTSWAWKTAVQARFGALRLPICYQRAWMMIGFGLLCQAFARAFQLAFSIRGIPLPTPSLADIGLTGFYPFVFSGLIYMLTSFRPQRTCVRVGLDACIMTFCLLGVSWFIFLAPALRVQQAAHSSFLTIVIVLSYPFWDVLLFVAAIMIIWRCAEQVMHPSLFLCVVGLFTTTLSDINVVMGTTFGFSPFESFLLLPLQLVSILLIGLASRYQYYGLAYQAYRGQVVQTMQTVKQNDYLRMSFSYRFIFLRGVLLYLPLCGLLALTVISEVQRDHSKTLFLLILTSMVGLILAARFLVTSYDNNELLNEQQRQHQDIEQLYRQLQGTYEQLQKLDQLKDQFLMTASHELRTPLAGVQACLEVLAEHEQHLSPEKRRTFLMRAYHSCQELVALLNHVMDVGRLEIEAGLYPVQACPVFVGELLQRVIILIGPQLSQEQRDVILHVPPHIAVYADHERLYQVFLNLCVNALKYSPAGTPLLLSARREHQTSQDVVISITDKGYGIPLEMQERLFQKFIRLERDMGSSIRGSGLGLYISRCLIDSMKGKIWIESTGVVGEGTTMQLLLPGVEDESY